MVVQRPPTKAQMRTMAAGFKRAQDQLSQTNTSDRVTMTFKEYISRMDPDYHFSTVHQKLVDTLQKVEAGEITRLMVFMPPQHGKTRTTSELFPAYFIGEHPDYRIISASYGDSYSLHVARKVRDQIDSPFWPYRNIHPSNNSKASGSWGILGRKGWYHATSIGGGATGRGAHLFLVDDPIKNPEEADSATYRQKIFDWFKAVAYTRRNNELIRKQATAPEQEAFFDETPDPPVIPDTEFFTSEVFAKRARRKAAIVIIQTRWHEDDLAGRLLREAAEIPGADNWTIINLPAIAGEHDQLGREPGEPLWPEMHPLEDLTSVQINLPARWWNAQYQQRPSSAGGTLFKLHWFSKRYDLRVLPAYQRIIQVCDSGWKKGVDNSYSVIQTWGQTTYSNDLLDVWRDRVSFVSLVTTMSDYWWKWVPYGLSALYIEDAASGIDAIQTLEEMSDERGFINVIPFSVAGKSQYTFVESATPTFAALRVRMPAQAPWLADYIAEMTSYPTAPRDDHPVATAMAMRILSGQAPTRKVDLSTFGRPYSGQPATTKTNLITKANPSAVMTTMRGFGGR